MRRATPLLLLILALTILPGCAKGRKVAAISMQTATAAEDQVIENFTDMAMVKAMAECKLRIAKGEDANAAINELAGTLNDIRLLCIQHERVNRLLDYAMLYIKTRQTYLEQLIRDGWDTWEARTEVNPVPE
ncbi:MAG: hypothetical protein GX616_24890 [Planctomycetes bacterium]|nr:hypothetical protein [Planctomycetota bacterium]